MNKLFSMLALLVPLFGCRYSSDVHSVNNDDRISENELTSLRAKMDAEIAEIPEKAWDIIHNYIQTTRHWSKEDYQLSYLGKQENSVAINVNLKESADRDYGKRLGSKYNFYVLLDLEKLEIHSEGKLQ